MRIIALILATTVFFLAFKPFADAMVLPFSSASSCCVKSCDALPSLDVSQDQGSKGSCNGNNCNPFQSCGTSFLICLSAADVSWTITEISTKRKFNYESLFSSQFITDFWQPPRHV